MSGGLRSIVPALCLVLGAVGCGDEGSTTAGSTTRAAAVGSGPPAKPPGPMTTQSGAQAAKRPEPAVTPPDGPPPRRLIVADLIDGSGSAARLGDDLAVHFVSIRVNGEFFESIWDKPFEFELGPEDVNPGWVRGLPGMRVGGRRELVVPTRLTSRYGVSSSEDDPQNALVYVVDLLEVQSGDSGGGAGKGGEPKVSVPRGAPPRKLVVEDLAEGVGAPAGDGDELTVEYVGVRYDGSPFTNSWERSEPFSFRLGSGDPRVSPGWEKGLKGMRVGGRRELIVPPGLLQRGGALPGAGPEDTLVYVVDLVSLE